LGAANWIGAGEMPSDGMTCSVKLRSTMAPTPAQIQITPEGGVTVQLEEPQYGISPGQACVFYDGDQVLGGGWIQRDAAEIAA